MTSNAGLNACGCQRIETENGWRIRRGCACCPPLEAQADRRARQTPDGARRGRPTPALSPSPHTDTARQAELAATNEFHGKEPPAVRRRGSTEVEHSTRKAGDGCSGNGTTV